jgi:hypothetical protein
MSQPAEGTTWDAGGFNNTDKRFLERGPLVAVLIRDARGTATDMSPHNPDGTVRWSPFALDRKLRADMFAFVRINGVWQLNPESNEGFHLIGGFKEGSGPSSKPKVDNDDFMIVQQNMPFDTDIVSESSPFTFTGVETAKPLLRRLENNLPLNGPDGQVLVELPGQSGAGWSKPLDADNVERQLLLVRARNVGGKKIYSADAYNLAKLKDIGEAKKGDKKDSSARDLTYEPLPDGIFMAMVDGEYRPILTHTFQEGDGWVGLAGAPILTDEPSVAAATTTGKATVAFDDPRGVNSELFVITVEVSTDAGATWSAGALDTPNAISSAGGTTTVKVKTLTAGATKLRGVVTGPNGKVARTPASNSITVT